MSAKIPVLKQKRGFVRKQVTEISTKVTAGLTNFDKNKCLEFIKKLKDGSAQLSEYDDEISQSLWDDKAEQKANEANLEEEFQTCSSYNDKVVSSLVSLEEYVGLLATGVNGGSVATPPDQLFRLKPRLTPLPSFAGSPKEDLEKFIYNFESALSKIPYSDFEKFLLLQESVTGRAKDFLASLEKGSQSYVKAKALLEKAFASRNDQIFSTMQRLMELKFNDNEDPLGYIGSLNSIRESMKTLEVTVDSMVQFFFWRSMSDKLRDAFIQITNENYPSLDDIENNLFKAVERIKLSSGLNEKEVKPKKSNVHSLAVKVEVDNSTDHKNICTLCENDHPYFKCDVYPTPEEKLARIRKLGGCEHCAYSNHVSSNCKLDKLKCKLCGGAHFPCLCVSKATPTSDKGKTPGIQKSNKSGSGGKNAKTKKVQSKATTFATYTSRRETEGGLALPTLSGCIGNSLFRIMKDTGSQCNFIEESVAEKCKLKIVKNDVSLTINGINSSKNCIAKIVEVPLTLGKNEYVIEAICVPNLEVDMKLPELGNVASHLFELNYELADKFIDEKSTFISNVKLILGSESSYILPVKTKLLKNDSKSSLLDTPCGIMMEGSLTNLLSDLKDLCVRPAEDIVSHGRIVSSNVIVADSSDQNMKNVIKNATDDMLSKEYDCIVGRDEFSEDDELNDTLSKFILENIVALPDGRLQIPILWNGRVDSLLANNRKLAEKILQSNLKKYLKNDKELLILTDNVIKEQKELGIVEEVNDLDQYLSEHPAHSFLAHMSVHRPDKDSTKCRVVFLSNLCERNPKQPCTLCHNQVIYQGPNLNKTMNTTLILLRFDLYLVCFDLIKAFLCLALSDIDSARLLFLWYKNPCKGDFTLVNYLMKRLPFGLPCSPSLLLHALYYILVDSNTDENETLRHLVYTLFYMDNGAFSTNDLEQAKPSLEYISRILGERKFFLQQIVSNVPSLQKLYPHDPEVKLFGLIWNTALDQLSAKKLYLDPEACTKRLILQSVLSNFDPFSVYGPLMNRAKLFLHKLQCNSSLKWDIKIIEEDIREWKLICRQVNRCDPIYIDRYIGHRDGTYSLVVFTDSSKVMYGCVLFIYETNSEKGSFLLAKNKIIPKQMAVKSVPALEFHALHFGTEILLETYREITDKKLLCPVNVNSLEVRSDSMVALHWLKIDNDLVKSASNLSVFVKNRLHKIRDMCSQQPITFDFIPGSDNPADPISRPVSKKVLDQTTFFSGPKSLEPTDLRVTIPNPDHFEAKSTVTSVPAEQCNVGLTPLLEARKFSSYKKVLHTYRNVYKYVSILKHNTSVSSTQKNVLCECDLSPSDKSVLCDSVSEETLYEQAITRVLKEDQYAHFPDCVTYLESPNLPNKDIPKVMKMLNLTRDENGIIRVVCKFGERNFGIRRKLPILLSSKSYIADLIILDLHVCMNHSGKYPVLSEMKKNYYVPKIFSKVKGVLKQCYHCKRFHTKTVQINQAPYREFRVSPSIVPFRFLFLDHFGPYNVKFNGEVKKIYVLILTCLYTRAVNLKICPCMGVESFLLAFQKHSHDFGCPAEVYSDLGTSIVAGGNVIKDFLKDPQSRMYLAEKGIKNLKFEQYYAGNSALGGVVESLVKISKRLIYGAVRNNILDYFHFEYLISDVRHLINKRVVTHKEPLRDDSLDAPTAITPEMLIHGYDLPSINCIPQLQTHDESDPNWSPKTSLVDNFDKLRRVRSRLIEIYENEFLSTLVDQAVDKKDRYVPRKHRSLSVGDIVLIKDKFVKPNHYPLGRIVEITRNVLGEVTNAVVRKGQTNELIKRHVTTLIPYVLISADQEPTQVNAPMSPVQRPRRRAAREAAQRISEQV